MNSMNKNLNNPIIDTIKDTFAKTDLPPLTWTTNNYSNNYAWLKLENPDQLIKAAEVLQSLSARLCTITAYMEDRSNDAKHQAIAYHFAIDCAILTVTVQIYDKETLEPLSVPSITSYFRNADWNEREFMEMYNIKITGHPNPKRLFLDERIDAGIMTKLIPFSSMVHGTGSKNLWEQVMLEKMGYVPESYKQALQEPAFTKVEETKIEKPKAEKKE